MLPTILFGLLILILCGLYWRWRKFVESLPPGPPPLPLIGNLLQFDRNDARQSFVKWHQQYGPLFTVWIGVEPIVCVTGFELMQELFVKRGDEFADRPSSFLSEFFTQGKYGIFNTSGEIWRDQRRFSLQTLRNFGLGRKVMEEKVDTETRNFLNVIEEELGPGTTRTGTTSKNINLKTDLELCVGNMITSFLLGYSFPPKSTKYQQLKSSQDECFNMMMTGKILLLNSFPILRFVPLFGHFGYDRLMMHCEIFKNFWIQELSKHKEELKDNSEPNDFAAAYLQEIRRKQESKEDVGFFGEWQLVCIMNDIWGAGMETTSTTLYWAFLLMMHFPEIQRKVQAEIDHVIGTERLPQTSDRAQMPFTTAVMNEIQRYSNILGAGAPRASGHDVEIMGYKIPKGLTFMPHTTALNYDETVFKDAQKFHPERFLESDGKTLKKYEQFMPFGMGRRICLGEGLARLELFVIFTSILQKFSLNYPKNQPKPSLTPTVGLTVVPHPYEISISRRHSD